MKIAVGQGSCGIAAGAMSAYEMLNSKLDLSKNQLTVTGCIGMCYLEPIVDIYDDNYYWNTRDRKNFRYQIIKGRFRSCTDATSQT